MGADYVKLFKAKGRQDRLRAVTKAVMGPEMPVYMVSVGALDAADYHADDAKVTEMRGGMQALAARRRVDAPSGDEGGRGAAGPVRPAVSPGGTSLR